MNKRYIYQMLKRWSLLSIMIFAVSVTLISCKEAVRAEECLDQGTDIIPPELTNTEIFISFQASELDRNSISYEDIKENPIKKVHNFINHLFAKKSVTVTFYIPNTMHEENDDEQSPQMSSGIVKLKFCYQDEKEYELSSEDGYFSVELPVEKGNSANEIAGKIMITEIEDAEGNVCRFEEGKEIKTEGMIVLDDVAPVLSKVSYMPQINSQTIGKFNYYFYQSAAKAAFEIVETNFEGVLNESEEKRLPIYSGGIHGEWSYDSKTKTAFSMIEFAEEDGMEREYQYDLFYMDPSGNLMAGKDKYVCGEGRYQNDIVVVDQKPPCLKSFSVESNSETKFIEEDGLLYAANVEEDDIKITVVIDDNEKYFDKENVLMECSVDGVHWFPLKGGTMCIGENREHRLVYTFDGEKNAEAAYQFRVSYKDRAGNVMVLLENHRLPVKETAGGIYTFSGKVVIDHGNPKLNALKFSKPVKMYQEEHKDSNGKLTTIIKDRNTKLYYSGDTKISFELEEMFLKSKDICIEIYERKNKGKEWSVLENVSEVMVKPKNQGIKVYFMLPNVDAEYYFTVSYTDRAGNPMIYGKQIDHTELGEAYRNGILPDTGFYTSPVFVRDTKDPVYEISYNHTPEKYNSVENLEMLLTLSEMNLDRDETIIKISAQDINGKPVQVKELKDFVYHSGSGEYVATWEELLEIATTIPGYPDAAEIQTLKLKLSAEANYRVFVEMVDKVWKKTTYENAYCIDRIPPSITVVTKDGQRFTDAVKVQCGLLDFSESDITYTVVDGGVIDRIIDKLTFGYFSKSKLSVEVKVHDQISGVAHLVPTCINEGNKITSYKLSKQMSIKEDKSTVKYEIELPIDFKGTVQMHGIDYAENEAKDTGAIGMIVESEKQHEKYAKSFIEVETPYSKTPNYYAGDVDIKYYVEDQYSGLCMVNYQAGEYNETIVYPAGEELCTETLKKHKIAAKENNTNHVNLAVDFYDNAGHEQKLAKENIPTVHIDQTSPKIQVVYDNMEVENEKYYKEDRIATVIIEERNFDPKDTNLYITGPSAEITVWKHEPGNECKGNEHPSDTNHKEDCKWVAKIHFSEDGEYTFTCDTTDLAGNQSTYGKTDDFIIDKTFPEMSVNYDNNNVKNEYYYKAPRTATIEIKEHNFKESDVNIQMTARNDEKILAVPKIGAWSSEGDIHRTTIVYDYDAQFEFEIDYTDLAGNKGEKYGKDSFIVDLTAPEIEILDILDCSANNGIVAPRIQAYDLNHDPEGMVLNMTGYKNGSVKIKHSKNKIYQGTELKLEDFAYLPELDDMYTLHAMVCDLAGNFSEKTVRFSVNRFGSVFTFDEKTEALVGYKGAYYTKEEPEIVVYETNVDTLKFWEITLNLNGKLKNLIEDKDFKVYENGNHESWKQYTYQIGKENFLEEGIYILTIYSEDRAKNLSDNDSKGKKLEFVVDKTAPSVLVTGIENGKQYRELSKEITIDVEDNVCIETMEVLLNGEKTNYNSIEIAKMNGRITYLLESNNDWQNLQVTAYDAAGNVAHSEVFKVLITPNIFVQMYRNTPVFYMSLGTLVILLDGMIDFWRKKQETEEDSSS